MYKSKQTEPLLHFSKVPCRIIVSQNFLPHVWGSLVHFHCHSMVVCFSLRSRKASLFLRAQWLGFLGFLGFFSSSSFFVFNCRSDCHWSPPTLALFGTCPFCVATNSSWWHKMKHYLSISEPSFLWYQWGGPLLKWGCFYTVLVTLLPPVTQIGCLATRVLPVL